MSDPQQPFDMSSLLEQAQQMSEQLMAAQEEAASAVFEGQAGGGAVRVSMTGGFEFRSVVISPDAVDPDDVDMLQDLVLAALNDVVRAGMPPRSRRVSTSGAWISEACSAASAARWARASRTWRVSTRRPSRR